VTDIWQDMEFADQPHDSQWKHEADWRRHDERPHLHHSTWEGEAKALRAENERLRRAMQAALTFSNAGAAPTAAKVLSDALREPHSAKSDFPGVTPSDDD